MKRICRSELCSRKMPGELSRAWLALTVLVMLATGIQASSGLQGEIRFAAERQGAVWLGQEVELYLDLWSDGFSFGDQLFVLPEVKGGYLLQADSSTVKLNENRNGVQWQGLRYTLLFYPQREGRLEVPSFEVRFSSRAGFGSEPAGFEFRTAPVFIEARLPPGADKGGLIVTSTSFTMEAAWTPVMSGDGPLDLQVGDAVTLKVTRRARDVPGMVFAPLPEFSIDGLGVYPEAAQVNDRINRGDLTGSRTDFITFICEREGSFKIPEMRFQWWDPEQEILAEKLIPEQELAVAANPAYASGAATVPSSSGKWLNWKSVVVVIAGILLLVYPGRWLAQFMAGRLPQLLIRLRAYFARWVMRANVLQPLNPRSIRKR